MGEARWTPGPWLTARTSEGEGYVLSVRYQAGGTQLSLAAVWDDGGMGIGEGISNARLIAAAPDLYEALVVAADLCVGTFAENGGPHKQMLAALAKANGETAA